MTTNRTIIQDAYRDAQIIPQDEEITALQAQTGLRKLNEMCTEWREDRILFDFVEQSDLSATIPIGLSSERAVKANLALAVLDDIGGAPPRGLIERASEAKKALVRRSLLYIQRPATTDHMPQGEGKRYTGNNILTDS